ncbi:hypothetical protein SAMN05878276_2071 [Aquipseudomonas alcaligenes]|uniref:hypothetical protein n=1 Tax=Aquipseudomonas alcaligenes TaxID=43263 RepID=UPI0009548EF3|nr:hypothetical protein [Pseudomonas alcaligenes]SIS08100.1 hypothetical protein SAMN05878276_2071 [Pseudomonas alcaligenes]
MKKVADNSFLQDKEKLLSYLTTSSNNKIILCDYLAMEIYKEGNIDSLNDVFSTLSKYPNQTIILKNIQTIARLCGRQAGLQRRLIDNNSTKELPKFCRLIKLAASGNQEAINLINKQSQFANEQLNILLSDADQLTKNFHDIQKAFTPAELKTIRTDGQYSLALVKKIATFIAELAVPLIHEIQRPKGKIPMEDFPNYFITRLAIYNLALTLRWIKKGGIQNSSPKKIRNDLIDALVATHATYFDGILSNDKNQIETYLESEHILKGILKKKQ